jgi:UDP-glucose 4-epimerase
VKELVQAFERVYGTTINQIQAPPRPGDIAGSYANADTAKRLIGWEAKLSIDDGIRDALKWGDLRTSILDFSK